MWGRITAAIAGAAVALLLLIGVLYFADLEIVSRGERETVAQPSDPPPADPPGLEVPSVLGDEPDDARATVLATGLEYRERLDGDVLSVALGKRLYWRATEQIPTAGEGVPQDATVTVTFTPARR